MSSSSSRCSSASFSCSRLTNWPERHAEDGVGLDGRERVGFLARRAPPRRRRSPRRPAPAAAWPPGVWISISRCLASACVGEVRMTRITSSMLAWASSRPFDRVLPLPGLGQQELRAAADHHHAVAEEFLQQLLERQHPRLAVDQRQEDQREACPAAARTGRAG